jgi:hypothetical protein
MQPIKVFIDTNILKFSATEQRRLVPRTQRIKWGDIEEDVTVHDIVSINKNDVIDNEDLKHEANLLSELAEYGKNGLAKYTIQAEAELESWGLPNMDSMSGKFYGAEIESIESPVEYGRVLMGGGKDAKELQFDFLSKLDYPRFHQLQKSTGAYQGEKPANHNQLLDAFHIWCAEYSNCDYFLTLDLKLIKVVFNSKKNKPTVKLVKPSALLAVLRKIA